MKKVVIATNNAHKVEEIRTALDFEGWEFLTLSQCEPYDEPAEDADTFEGNALIKALAAHEHTGLAALADDSGLAVDALDGAPANSSGRNSGSYPKPPSPDRPWAMRPSIVPEAKVCVPSSSTNASEHTKRAVRRSSETPSSSRRSFSLLAASSPCTPA